MYDHRPTRRKQLLREAEGYLDLLMVFADAWEPSPVVRDRLARRALATLKRLDEQDQQQAHALYLHGQALRTMEHYEEAVEHLRRAADAQPGSIRVWLALGWCYKRLGRLDLAIDSLEEALSVEPREALIHYNLACYCSLSGNAEMALSYLSRALKIQPSYRDLIHKERDFDPIRKHPSFRELTSVVV
ncbi:MAG: tetratricopeptide repeat protein [Planctomycetota bacterium]|nr:tetratricopeptide repeat protein [Planctomycetota bacterium]